MTARLRGFSLVELVVVISVIGIIAALGAIFARPAVEAYSAQRRRGELTDIADTALRRMARDVQRALPNSVRSDTAAGIYLGFLSTRAGGRYRSQPDNDPGTTEDVLDFSAPDGAFDMLGLLSSVSATVDPGDRVVVHNLGIDGANAYAGDNTAVIAGVAAGASGIASEQRITLAAPMQFPLESPGRRFQIISGPVVYECRNPGVAAGEGTGLLLRHEGFGITPVWPPPAAPTASPAVVATRVSDCALNYAALALQARGVVSVRLQLTRDGETVTLYREIHVNNVP